MGSLNLDGIAWIGLGAMGLPMAGHLATKLPAEVSIYVYDIVRDFVEQICKQYPGKVKPCSSAKEAAERSVCLWSPPNTVHD